MFSAQIFYLGTDYSIATSLNVYMAGQICHDKPHKTSAIVAAGANTYHGCWRYLTAHAHAERQHQEPLIASPAMDPATL